MGPSVFGWTIKIKKEILVAGERFQQSLQIILGRFVA
jgi:hypothetical protein